MFRSPMRSSSASFFISLLRLLSLKFTKNVKDPLCLCCSIRLVRLHCVLRTQYAMQNLFTWSLFRVWTWYTGNNMYSQQIFKKCHIPLYTPCDNSSASFAAFISACWILWPDAFARRSPRKYTATVYTLVFVGPLHSITLQTKCEDINCTVHHWCDTKTFC